MLTMQVVLMSPGYIRAQCILCVYDIVTSRTVYAQVLPISDIKALADVCEKSSLQSRNIAYDNNGVLNIMNSFASRWLLSLSVKIDIASWGPLS